MPQDSGGPTPPGQWDWPWASQRRRFWHRRPEVAIVGYWSGPMSPGYPDIRRFVDPTWDPPIRREIVEYLRAAPTARTYLGWSDCRVCRRMNGTREQSDGTFVWPDGLAHYVEDHDVRLPEPFVRHVRASRSLVDDWAALPGDAMSQLGLVFGFMASARPHSRWWSSLSGFSDEGRTRIPGAG